MKSSLFTLLSICLPLLLLCQEMGNANYGNAASNGNNSNIKSVKAPVQYHNSNQLTIEVAGIYNLESDGYIAIFAASQSGKTAEETDQLMNNQIEKVRSGLQSSNIEAEIFVDMISFIPLYEYAVEKKIFSKKTYKEVPSGFEMKKNLHIRYQDADALEKIISLCAKAEIYDLVKVDHYSEKLEQFKEEMRTKAIGILKEKIQFHKEVLNIELDSKDRTMGEGFLMFYPTEQYRSYQAYCNTSITPQQQSKVRNVQKSTTYYYSPVFPKQHDFIMNAEKIDPGMQLLYTLSVSFDLKEKKDNPAPVANSTTKKEYILITANGQIKTLPIE